MTMLTRRRSFGSPGVGGGTVSKSRTLLSSTLLDAGDPFSGYGMACLLSEGNTLAGWARSEDADGSVADAVWGAVGTDLGTDWADPAQILAAPDTGGYYPAGLTKLASGSVLASIPASHAQYVMISPDGETWGDLITVASPAAMTNFALGSGAVLLGSGALLMPFYGAAGDDPEPYFLGFSRNADGTGTSWADTGVTLTAPDGFMHAEPQLCLLDDGRLVMTIRYMEVDGGQALGTYITYSDDGEGDEWTTPTLAIPDSGPWPAVMQTPDLDVCVLTRDLSGGDNGPIVFFSQDRGETWSDGLTIGPSEMAYMYGQWAYVGDPDTDGALICVSGANNDSGSSLYSYSFSKIAS